MREKLPDRVYIDDVRHFNFCIDGLVAVLDAHGHTLRGLIKHGVPVADLEAADDANVKMVLDYIKETRNVQCNK